VKLLLLGGYQFVGRAIIEAAQARGHAVSAFNRGNHPPLPDVEQFTGDRADPALPDDRTWDAVVDTSGYLPRHTRIAAERLRDRTRRYVFISSISAYAQPMRANTDESGALAQMPAGADPDAKPTGETYGALKVLCEESLEAAMPGRVLTIRPGFIVGPYDYTDRFNSWIERAAKPGPLLVPGDPAHQPVQLIDVRDLAEWIVALIERQATGTYNATGPAAPLTLLDVARTCLEATGSGGTPATRSAEALKTAGITGWEHIPFWVEADDYPIMQANVDRAVAAGLRFRPLVDTIRDTYAWLHHSDHPRKIVLDPDLERAALEPVGD